VAAVSGIGDDAIERVADDRLHGRDDGGELVAVIRVTGQRRDVGDELATARMLQGRRTLSPTRDAVRRVFDDRVDARVGEVELFDRDTELHFADAYEKLMRASEALDLSRDLVAGVRDYYQAKVANDQNEIMKRLTIVASLLLPASLVVGFYGMNVHGIPEYRWSFGYEYVIALIVAVTAAQLVWFRRKRWL